VIKLFQAKKQNDEQQDLSAPAVDADKDAAADRFKQKLLQNAQELDSPERAAVMKFFQGKKKEEQQDQSALDTEKHEESVDNDSAADTRIICRNSRSALKILILQCCHVRARWPRSSLALTMILNVGTSSLRCGRRCFSSLHLVAGLLSTTSI